MQLANSSKPPKPRSALLAVTLSGLFPGLGQLYNGERRKAFLFGVFGLLTAFGPFSPLEIDIDPQDPMAGLINVLLGSLPFMILATWCVVDAYRGARRSVAGAMP